MGIGMYSGTGSEVLISDIDDYNLEDDMPKAIADIVAGQLEGYGYSHGKYNGHLVRFDLCYSNDGVTEIFECSARDLLEDAINFRTELLDERYGDDDSYDENDDSVKELRVMEAYWATL